MDRIEIPNDATYSPIALMDVLLEAPLASRVLLGATLPGRVLSMAALGVYAGSSLRDWWARQGVRRIDFMQEFGSDIPHLDPMPELGRQRIGHDEPPPSALGNEIRREPNVLRHRPVDSSGGAARETQVDAVIDLGPGVGTWKWMNDNTWIPLHGLSPEDMVTGHLDGV